MFGAVTQPWAPNPVFRGLPREQFQSFREPGYVKIAWSLRVDPIGGSSSMAYTETRVTTTDAVSRGKFRRYWAFFSPGILATRWFALHMVRTDAERITQTRS